MRERRQDRPCPCPIQPLTAQWRPEMTAILELIAAVTLVALLVAPEARHRLRNQVDLRVGRVRNRLGFRSLKSLERQAIRQVIDQRVMMRNRRLLPNVVTVLLNPSDYKAHRE